MANGPAAIWIVLASAALLLGAGAPAGAAQAAVSLEAGRTPGVYHLRGAFSLLADPHAAWTVITDYDGIGRFVSSVRSSRVLSRTPGGAVVEQVGTGRFSLLYRRTRITLAMRETPPYQVQFEQTSGAQFRVYAGTWTITEIPGGCSVAYELTAEPAPSLGPGFTARKALKKNTQILLDDVAVEIQRRSGKAR